MERDQKSALQIALRNVAIELLVYGGLSAAYFYAALHYLAEPLQKLVVSNLTLYGVVGLGLIIVQVVFLEIVVSFLFDFLGINRLK